MPFSAILQCDAPESTSKPASSGLNLQFMQSQIRLKQQRAAQQSSKPKPNVGFALKPRKAVPLPATEGLPFSFIPKAITEDKVFLFGEVTIEDEYDPTTPSEFAVAKQRRDEQNAKLRLAREIADRAQREHDEEEAKRKKGAAIAPPTFLLEDSAPVVVEQPPPQPSTSEFKVSNFSKPPPPAFIPSFGSGSKGLGIAASIMSKMGYKEGSGLGKSEQGMSTALKVEKLGKNAGFIKAEKREAPAPAPAPAQPDLGPITSNMAMVKSATKVLLLRNMVTKEEVDGALEPEIRGEMQKYGQVTNVVIHPYATPEPEEEVRIFVEFTNMAQAIKAFIELNGRFFGGRPVRAGFYPVDFYEMGNYDKALMLPS